MATVLTQYTNEEFKAFLKEAIREVMTEENERIHSDMDETYTAKQAAGFLKLELSTLYEKTSKKLIPHFKKGNKLYFHKTELTKWIEKGRVKTKKDLETEAATALYNMQTSKDKGKHSRQAA